MNNEIQIWYKSSWGKVIVGLLIILILVIFSLYVWKPLSGCEKYADLQIFMDKQLYNQREPIYITANISIHKQAELGVVYGLSPLVDFDVFLTDSQKSSILLTDQGREENFASGSRIISSLPPDELPYERTFDISPWFELSASDTYTLTIEKRVWFEGCEEADILSETVNFTRLP